MIEVESVSKSFGPVRALFEVSLRAGEGEAIGVLGPNGSGKTTLFRLLTGFLRADAGRIVVAGVDLGSDAFEVRRRVGYLPERAPLYPELTVDRFLRLALDIKLPGVDRPRARIDATLEQCGLVAVRQRRVGGLSKGYRQRVGVAQALIAGPQVLVLDEPTSGLDPASVIELRALVRGLAGRTTILLSSHILADVARVCDRVVVLDRGRTVLDARLDELDREVRRRGELVLRTRGSEEAVRRAIDEASSRVAVGVVESRLEAGPSGTVIAHLRQPSATGSRAAGAAPEDDAGPLATELARACVAADLPVLEIGPRRQGLDELLVEILALDVGQRPGGGEREEPGARP